MFGVGRRERLVERANVGAVEGVNQLLDVRAIDFDQLARHRGIGAELVDALLELFRAFGILAEQGARGPGAFLEQLGQRLAREFVGTLRNDYRLQMRREAAHRAADTAMLAAVAEPGQLDQPAHRQRIHVRGAELVDGFVAPGEQRRKNRNHRVRRQIDRYDVEHQFALGRVEAIAAAGKISQRSAGVDALVPSRERIAKGALDNRGTRNGRRDRVLRGEHQLLTEALAVAVGVGPSPSARALQADLLQPLLDPSLAPALSRGFMGVAAVGVGVDHVQLVGLAHLVVGFSFHAGDGGERVANFAPQREVAPAVGAPVDRSVVLETMAVGIARGVAGRNVKQGGAALAAELDHMGNAGGVDRERFFQRGLEVDQPGAMHHRVDLAAAGRFAFGDQVVFGDVAAEHGEFFVDVAVEAVAQMFAQGTEYGRIENFAAQATKREAPVAADEQIDAFDLRMPAQEQREEDLAEKAGRAGEQDAAAAQRLFERRHRGARGVAVSSVAIRHRLSPAAVSGDR